MKNTKTLVFGASENPTRYSYKAIQLLTEHKHQVVAISRKEGMVSGIQFDTTYLPYQDIDTVTLYINPTHQEAIYEYIISLQPKRVIFNPDTENLAFSALLNENGIVTENACTLVLLRTGQY